jgi:hypothetical protein
MKEKRSKESREKKRARKAAAHNDNNDAVQLPLPLPFGARTASGGSTSATSSATSLVGLNRVRGFEHVEGKWAVHVYLPVSPIRPGPVELPSAEAECGLARGFADMYGALQTSLLAKNRPLEPIGAPTPTLGMPAAPAAAADAATSATASAAPRLDDIHLSLSRTSAIQYHEIEPLVARLRSAVRTAAVDAAAGWRHSTDGNVAAVVAEESSIYTRTPPNAGTGTGVGASAMPVRVEHVTFRVRASAALAAGAAASSQQLSFVPAATARAALAVLANDARTRHFVAVELEADGGPFARLTRLISGTKLCPFTSHSFKEL